MKTRVITAIVALCVFVPVILFSGTWVFPIAVAICALISVWEMLRCCELHKKWAISIPMLLISAVVSIVVKLVDNFAEYLTYAVPTVMVLVLYLLAVMVFSKGKIGIEDISICGFSTLYIVFAYVAILFLRYYNGEFGTYVYLLVFVGAWITDIFAYFCGMLFGKHKLIPEVSPKKTIEGSIGGILFCGIAYAVYGLILKYAFELSAQINLLLLFVYGVVASVVSQIGDLSMSAIKRRYEIKDYGKIFPGHGGMLDRFDSILAVATVLFIMNEMFGIFTAIV